MLSGVSPGAGTNKTRALDKLAHTIGVHVVFPNHSARDAVCILPFDITKHEQLTRFAPQWAFEPFELSSCSAAISTGPENS
jgi:hypothetical protein